MARRNAIDIAPYLASSAVKAGHGKKGGIIILEQGMSVPGADTSAYRRAIELVERVKNPRRPTRQFMQRYETAVSRTRVQDPAAVCAAAWQRMTLAQRKAWVAREVKRNSIPGLAPVRRESAIRVGSRVTVQGFPGVFTVMRVLQNGRLHARRSDGAKVNAPLSGVRAARNPMEPTSAHGVELHAVTYKEQKRGDKSPKLYEHEFEGRAKPRLRYDGRDLKIKRAGSRYTVKDGWIHG